MDLSILSAESYYDGVLDNADPPTEHHDGGDTWTASLPSSSSQPRSVTKQRESLPNRRARQPSKRESSKTANAEESSGARQRGRPRLDTRDQTAAERRRTQIRLAQRAYRQRKETTISALNRRVATLEQTIERMNRTFLDFNDKAIASGIGDWEPGLAGNLKSTMEHFIDCARSVAPESEAEDGEHSPVPSPRAHELGKMHSDSRRSSPSKAKQAVRSPSPSPGTDMGEMVAASALGYQTTYRIDDGTDDVNAQNSGFDTTQDVQISNLENTFWAPVEPAPLYRPGFPVPMENMQSVAPPLSKSLPPPVNYNFQEISFARRLLRTTLQNGVRLLTDPNASRDQVFNFFRFTFTWTNRPRCLAMLKQLISRTAHESLEFWGAPQWHVGDSGLHYPRGGLDGASSPPPGWTAKAPMGPRRPVATETPISSSLVPEEVFKITGLGGTWLDSNDVDQYLQTRGVFLDGQSNWAEIDLAVDPTLEPNLTVGSPTDSSRNSSGGPQSPDLTYPDGPVMHTTEYLWDGKNLGMPNFADVDMGMLYNEHFDTKSLNAPGSLPTNGFSNAVTNVNPSKRLCLDVDNIGRWVRMPGSDARIPSKHHRCGAQFCDAKPILILESSLSIAVQMKQSRALEQVHIRRCPTAWKRRQPGEFLEQVVFGSAGMPDVYSIRADLSPHRRWRGIHGAAPPNRCGWDDKVDFRPSTNRLRITVRKVASSIGHSLKYYHGSDFPNLIRLFVHEPSRTDRECTTYFLTSGWCWTIESAS
ncbi:hypothetical protein MMC07_007332 [Pseudocyphellaria aurata]|nr:hypothetical protein [Pseudocyphellaria aurata]